MNVAVCEKCRRIRLVLMALLIVLTALAGYHWGAIFDSEPLRIEQHDVIILAVAFTVLAAMVAIGIEMTVTRTEMEAAAAWSQHENKALESRINQAHARELDRIVDRLSEDNSDLRDQLMKFRVHEAGEETAHGASDLGAARHAWRQAS